MNFAKFLGTPFLQNTFGRASRARLSLPEEEYTSCLRSVLTTLRLTIFQKEKFQENP